MNKYFLESISTLGLSTQQKEALCKMFSACFEGPQPLTVPSSVVMDTNIYNGIQVPMGRQSVSSSSVDTYQYPMSKSTSSSAMRDYRKEAKEMFAHNVGVKIKKRKTDPQIASMMKKAKGHMPSYYAANAVGTSMMPMATGYSAPNRNWNSPFRQGCAVGSYDGGGGSSNA